MPQAGVWENDFAGPKYDMAPQQQASGGYTPAYRQDVAGYNPSQYATTETANQLAQMLGGQVVQTQMGPGSPFNVPNQNSLSFGSGSPLNAGLVAGMYQRYPKAVADAMMQAEFANAGIGAGGSAMSFNNPESQFNTNVAGGQNFLGRGTGQLPGANLGPNPTSNSGLNVPATSAGTNQLAGNDLRSSQAESGSFNSSPFQYHNSGAWNNGGNSGGDLRGGNFASGNSGSPAANNMFGFGGSMAGINPFALQSLAGLMSTGNSGSLQGRNARNGFRGANMGSGIGRAPGYTFWQPRGGTGGRNSLATGFRGFAPGAGSIMNRTPPSAGAS